jgi:hypothetical protein
MEYPLAERQIFTFWDGSATVGVDPLEVQATLLDASQGDLQLECQLAESPSPSGEKARRNVVAAVRQAFGVKPFRSVDGVAEGLTEVECVKLLTAFVEFVALVKKKLREPPSSPPPSPA